MLHQLWLTHLNLQGQELGTVQNLGASNKSLEQKKDTILGDVSSPANKRRIVVTPLTPTHTSQTI